MKEALIAAIVLSFICSISFAEHEEDFFPEDNNWIARKREAASSERIKIDLMCRKTAQWAGDVFDTLEQNPAVILNGMTAEDEDRLAFIRKWHRDGETRDDLLKFIFNHCAGTEV